MKSPDLLARRIAQGDCVMDIGSIKATDKCPPALECKPLNDVFAGWGICRRSQRDPGYMRKTFRQKRECRIIGAEIMPPLRNAMRLINREERQGALIQQVSKTQALISRSGAT